MRLLMTSLGTMLVVGGAACARRESPAPSADPTASAAPARAHKRPPAAKGARHAAIAMPALSAHLPSKNLVGEKTGEHPCGTAHVEGGDQPLECFEEGSTRIDDAAKPVIAHTTLAAGKSGALPERVDHRLDGLEGPVRAQGKAPSCTGFSLAATIDEAVASELGRPGDVSALHLWSRYAVTKMGDAVKQNKDHPLAEEPVWPYDANLAEAFFQETQCKSGKLSGEVCSKAPDRSKQQEADHHPYVTLLGTTQVDSSSTEALERKLAGGQDIWFCAKIAGHLSCGKKGCNLEKLPGSDDMYVRDFDAQGQPGGHCMSLAGYQKTPEGTYFLIHNSWGEGWGNKGYAFVHEKTFAKNVEKGATFTVQAHVVSKAPGGAPAPAPTTQKACPAGQLHDSHGGQCEPACPDGSARHDGACAETTGCPADQVNVTGHCVPAAPQSHGTDAGSGVTYACAPGGCSYTIPKGKLGCTEDHCSVSCSAPKYQLAAGPNGTFCTP